MQLTLQEEISAELHDHLIPVFNIARYALGLSLICRFRHILSCPAIIEALQSAHNIVNMIDGLAGHALFS